MIDETKKPCECHICVRSREFKKHIATIEDVEAKKFMENIFSQLWDVEEDLEMTNIYQRNLRETYPTIYREMRTIARIEPGTEKHPEINI